MIARLAAALTERRLTALALVSLLATTAVVLAATRQRDSTTPALLAALRSASRTAPASSAATPASAASVAAPPTGRPTATPAPRRASHSRSSQATSTARPTAPAAATPAAGSTGTPAASQPAASKIKHVFVIALAAHGDQAFAPGSPARYLDTQLRPRGALLSAYSSLSAAELPDYIALISGQPPNPLTTAECPSFADFPRGAKPGADGQVAGSGCVYPITTLTLPDQLTSARLTWRAYAEDMGAANGAPVTCRHPAPGAQDPTAGPAHGDEYATRHNPFVYFHSLLDLGDCSTNDVSLGQLGPDLATAKTTPNFAFIAPNLCHAGAEQPCQSGDPGGLAAADTFLGHWVPAILQSPAYRKDGLLIIAFAGASATQKGTGALLLSRYAQPGSATAVPYTPYSLLRSFEDIFALRHLAGAGAPGVRSLLTDALKRAA